MLTLDKSGPGAIPYMPLAKLHPGPTPTDLASLLPSADFTSALLSCSAAAPISALGIDPSMYVVQMVDPSAGCHGIHANAVQCLGITGGTLCCACYQGFPAAQAPAPPCTAIATATVPTVTALTTAYPQQPLATTTQPPPPPTATFQRVAAAGPPAYHQNGGASSPNRLVSSYGKYRPRYNSMLPGGRCALKRKAEDTLSTDSGDSGHGSSGSADHNPLLQPLYCKICRVTLNAPAQAKQHYEGKNHAKKVKLTDCSNQTADSGTTSTSGPAASSGKDQPSLPGPPAVSASPSASPSSTSSAGSTSSAPPSSAPASPGSPAPRGSPPPPRGPPAAEINPDIYCKICGVSFNSDKQSQQHYKGKNHAKKVRATEDDRGNGYRRGSRYRCYLCNIHLASKELLLTHLRGPRHQEKLKAQGKGVSGAAMWANGATKDLSSHPGIPFGLTLTHGPTAGLLSGNHGYTTAGTYHHSNHHRRPHQQAHHQRPAAQHPSNGVHGNSASKKMDFTMYRTPSGKFYCPSCNVTMNSENLFAQHVDSRKHRSCGSTQHRHNNNNNNNSTTLDANKPVVDTSSRADVQSS